MRVVMSGAGAAGTAILRLLLAAGAQDVVVADIEGVIHKDRDEPARVAAVARRRHQPGRRFPAPCGTRWPEPTSSSASPRPTCSSGSDIATMAEGSIVFALANPVPEVDPGEARTHAAVVATGRSDYPNQINNVLAFPGVFRGLLDASATRVDEALLLAAAEAIADAVSEDELNANYIIPSVFHADVHTSVAAAVRQPQRRPEPMPEPGPAALRAGQLLVATPALVDPNFAHSVVLLLDHDEDGALGVVLNRPSPVPVADILAEWSELADRAACALPRRTGQHGLRARGGHGAARCGRVGRTGRLAAAVRGHRHHRPGRSHRAGRPGASPGCGSSPGTPGGAPSSSRRRSRRGPGTSSRRRPPTCSRTDPEGLWARVLRRQPGELAWVSTRPLDPTLN